MCQFGNKCKIINKRLEYPEPNFYTNINTFFFVRKSIDSSLDKPGTQYIAGGAGTSS